MRRRAISVQRRSWNKAEDLLLVILRRIAAREGAELQGRFCARDAIDNSRRRKWIAA